MKNRTAGILFCVVFISAATAVFAQQQEERVVPSFSGVSLGIAADLYLTQGSPAKVIVEGDESSLENIVTEVKGGILIIRNEKRWTRKIRNVNIWVTTPEIEELNLSGSGSIIAEGPVNTEELEMKVSGSGNITLDELTGDELDAAISGSGDIYLTGSVGELDIRISGSGGIKAPSLTVDECSVKISGSGNCEINAGKELEAHISGSGKVIYFSNPRVNAFVSGSGRVINGND